MARGAAEGAAIKKSGGQRRRTNIGDIRGFDWATTSGGHECRTIPSKSDERRGGSTCCRDSEIECTSGG